MGKTDLLDYQKMVLSLSTLIYHLILWSGILATSGILFMYVNLCLDHKRCEEKEKEKKRKTEKNKKYVQTFCLVLRFCSSSIHTIKILKMCKFLNNFKHFF